MNKREIRARASLERRALSDQEKAAGYIGALVGEIPYNSDSELLARRGNPRRFVERLAPDAFKRSLAEDADIMLNAGHTDDPLASLARIGENLTVASDARALRYEALVPDTAAGADLLKLVDLKIVRGTSFEFEVREGGDRWEKRDAQTDLRTITEARLIALNPVIWPAYSDSSLTVELRRREHGTEERAAYWAPDGIVDYWDPAITPDTKYAHGRLERALWSLADSLDYLRARPDGAHAELARTEVSAATERIKALADWLAANGAEINPALQAKMEARLAEARSQFSEPDYDRERRYRVLKLGSL